MATTTSQQTRAATDLQTTLKNFCLHFEQEYLIQYTSSNWERLLIGSSILTCLALIPAWMGLMDFAFVLGGVGMVGSFVGYGGDLVTMRERENLQETFFRTSGINYLGAILIVGLSMHPVLLAMGVMMVCIATLCYHGCSREWLQSE